VDKIKGIECYVDAEFSGAYDKNDSTSPRDCLSGTGLVVKYAGCPIVWGSKLQTTIALATTEAEYMALSAAAREVLYLMHLTNELKEHKIAIVDEQPTIQIRVFEDNVGAVELARLPKLRPTENQAYCNSVPSLSFLDDTWVAGRGSEDPRNIHTHNGAAGRHHD
jgi:hypothetical protein